MYYTNDSITSIPTKWLSQLLQKVEANKLWSWGEAEKSGKFKIQFKKIKLWSKFTGRTCVPCVRLRAPLQILRRHLLTYFGFITYSICQVDDAFEDNNLRDCIIENKGEKLWTVIMSEV